MSKIPTALFLNMFFILSMATAYSEMEVDHFSSSNMQQAFKEGMVWAKREMKQDTFEITPIHPLENYLEDQSVLIDTEEDSFKCVKGDKLHFSTSASPEGLYIFISFSMPEASLRELSYDLEKIGGCFVIRGLPQNSFKVFFEKMNSLKEQGILAPILIDPESFENLHIERVPTFVLKNGGVVEKFEGNVRLRDVLSIFSGRAMVGELAGKLLEKLSRIYKQSGVDQQELNQDKIPKEGSIL